MIATIEHRSKRFKVDLSNPLDISIPMDGSPNNVIAWYVDSPIIKAHEEDGFVGAVAQGASVNFNNIQFNPHSHITHTECVGHITERVHSINTNLKGYFFFAELVTVAPEKVNDDFIISKKQLQYVLGNKKRQALVIRTLPNLNSKMTQNYSHTNPPYLEEAAAAYLCEKGIDHLLIDLPSVDREKDDGKLLSHHAFWNVKGQTRMNATITEFIFVPNTIEDGAYLLELQVAPIENDASPSRPVLYGIL